MKGSETMHASMSQTVKRMLFILVLLSITFFSSIMIAGETAQAATKPHSHRLIGIETTLPNHQKVFSNKFIQKSGAPILTSAAVDCLSPDGYGDNVTRDSVAEHYDITAWVENDCSDPTINGGEWGEDIDAVCNGQFIESASTSGGLARINVGNWQTVLDQAHYDTTCVYSNFSESPPDYVVVYLTASAQLTNEEYVTGGNSFDV